MFHPESNPLAPKSSGPKKPEKKLVEIWLGKDAAALMEDKGAEMGDEEDLNPKGHELTEREKRKLWEMKRPDEVTLRNIPEWKELPDKETFIREFKFHVIWEREYRKDRSIEEFEVQNRAETVPLAKVFGIADAITIAKEKDPKHYNNLTTDEVLEAIDQAGYRPATLEELLAYAHDYWKPNADPKTLAKEERELQNAQAPRIYGLNSVFSGDDGHRRVPYLDLHDDRRWLNAYGFGSKWSAFDRFLVLRKSSPS